LLRAAGVLLLLALAGVIASAQKVVTPPEIRNFGKLTTTTFAAHNQTSLNSRL